MVYYRDVLFFAGISIMTIIVVQTILYFINDDSSVVTKIIVISIEGSLILIMLKIYDDMSRWEQISKVISGRFFNRTSNQTYDSEKISENLIKYCSYCGYNISVGHGSRLGLSNRNEANIKDNIYPKYCINCGSKIKT